MSSPPKKMRKSGGSATVASSVAQNQAAQTTENDLVDDANMEEELDPASMYEDDEGGYRVGDIYIPPPIKPYCSSESKAARLIITKIMNTNFKSYADDVPLGPFCHRFHAIIGPNGSGKSNVIDSMLFVFGYRSNKIRSKNISSMIHKSKKYPNVNGCRVAVHFAQIEDNDDGTYRVSENSEFFIAREAFRNNSSFYTINDRRVQFKEVAALLKRHSVDLDHNRFLILQGEVESIAMMKPKAQSENECGHLEYLEDIIGTTRYKEPLLKIQARVDVLSEERTEKHNRCKMAERELNDLKAPMEEAVAYLKMENDLTRTRNKEIQIHICNMNKNLQKCSEELEEKTKNLEEHDKKYEAIIKEREEKENQIKEEVANHDRIVKKKEEHENMKKNAQSKYDEIQSTMTETNKRRKQIQGQLKKKESELEELKRQPTKNEKEIDECERKIERFTKEQEEAKLQLAKNAADVKVLIEPLNKKKDKLAADLASVQLKYDNAKAELDVIEKELQLVKKNETDEKKRFENYQESLDEAKKKLEDRRKEYKEAELEIPKIRSEITQVEAEINNYRIKEQNLQGEYENLRRQIEERKVLMQQAKSNNKVLEHLMRKKLKGELPGIMGRLGDLGGIDKKYDVAISTCCPRLNDIIVDTVETGEQCINSLKHNNVGRGNFLALEKIQDYGHYERDVETPENVPRLIDLVRIEDERIRPAFYYALNETLVANDMDQATRVSYGAVRKRVVTLKGDVIEIAGTMTGGGKSQIRGRIGEKVKTKTTNLNTSVGNTTVEDLSDIQEKAQKIQDEINHCQQLQGEKGRHLKALHNSLPAKERDLKRLQTDVDRFAHQIPGLEAQLKEQRTRMEQTRSDPKKVAELEGKMNEKKVIFNVSRDDTKKFTDQIDTVARQIQDLTEEKMHSIEKNIDNLEKNITKFTKQVTKLKVEISTCERNIAKTESTIATLKEDIETAQNDLYRMADERTQAENDIEEIESRLREILKEISETSNGSSEANKEVLALQKQESDAKLQRVELEQTLQKFEKAVRDLKANIPVNKKKLEPLKLHNIPNEENPLPLKEYSNDELAGYVLNDVQYRISVLEDDLKAKRPNLNVIDEYQKKRDVYMDRIKVLEEITNKRNEMRKLHDDIKKRRYTEFMQGFNIITHKLKEMYQMITQGGNADLELVDSMDPFSEGVTFSVRPPRKSWKNISNLSGGEKTLSSLALVFALHYYKPSPLYFMDEIDAALDFKNVSIVANYIKERTKNAQFIIISLRSNMFELADYLTGIYKVDDCTDSITIQNVEPKSVSNSAPSSQILSSQRNTASDLFTQSQVSTQSNTNSTPLPDQSLATTPSSTVAESVIEEIEADASDIDK